MLLEWMQHCPKCGAVNHGIALPPWSWLTRLWGARCWRCDHRWNLAPEELA